jgi:hypothetical protein
MVEARIEGWFKRPKKGGQIRKNKKNLRYVIIEGCKEEASVLAGTLAICQYLPDTPQLPSYQLQAHIGTFF